MCGRYALGIRAAFVRYQFQQQHMPVDEAPEDDETRETYNFAPGYYGLVYRADVPSDPRHAEQVDAPDVANTRNEAPHTGMSNVAATKAQDGQNSSLPAESNTLPQKYMLQAMKWGLIPFWTKRNPDYGSLMKTINCRDDSLMENRGMWNSMKRTKRCVVVAQGFYEWLKKNGGKEKVPHFVRRKDGQLMLFAGLWDSVRYDGSDQREFTYTIITTDVNKQLAFLHDRMPIILDIGSDPMWKWLDPSRSQWTNELQSLLKPFRGELECYAVSKEVGKVGNNSPNFIVPVASSENKQNIANFFNTPKQQKGAHRREEAGQKHAPPGSKDDVDGTPASRAAKKRGAEDTKELTPSKAIKVERDARSFPKTSPSKSASNGGAKKVRSATNNGLKPKVVDANLQQGNRKITNFFGKP